MSASPTDGRPNYCLHDHHPDPDVEAKAREIYMARYGMQGGWWEFNETPEPWWNLAIGELQRHHTNARIPALHPDGGGKDGT